MCNFDIIIILLYATNSTIAYRGNHMRNFEINYLLPVVADVRNL